MNVETSITIGSSEQLKKGIVNLQAITKRNQQM